MSGSYLDESKNLTCPVLTKKIYDDDEEAHGCVYTSLAYGLFAVVALIIVGIPFVLFFCYIHRKIRRKKEALGVRPSSASRNNSCQDPYQPLLAEYPSSGYGAVYSTEDEPAITSPRSHDSDRHSQQPDVASIASSRASTFPNYDEASLKHRNAQANRNDPLPSSDGLPASRSRDGKGKGSRNLSVGSQESTADQSGHLYDSVDVVSKIPRLDAPSDPKRQSESRSIEPPVYAVLEEPETDGSSQPTENNAHGSYSFEEPQGSQGSNTSPLNTTQHALPEPSSPGEPNNLENPEEGQGHGHCDKNNKSMPEQQNSLLTDKEAFDGSVDTDLPENSHSSDKSITVLPSERNHVANESVIDSSVDSEQVTGSGGPMSREEYKEFLLKKVRALPANERDGVFLIRDSYSSRESKALTMYCWNPDSNKELYHFKICFTENGQAYLNRDKKLFSNLNNLLEYLREYKHMLPCVLTTQVFPKDERKG